MNVRKKKDDEKRHRGEKNDVVDKQGREEGLPSQHALIRVTISVVQPSMAGRSPWHTAFINAVSTDVHQVRKTMSKKSKKGT